MVRAGTAGHGSSWQGENYCGRSAVGQGSRNIRALHQPKTLLPSAQSGTRPEPLPSPQGLFCFPSPQGLFCFPLPESPGCPDVPSTTAPTLDWKKPPGPRGQSHPVTISIPTPNSARVSSVLQPDALQQFKRLSPKCYFSTLG